MHIFLTYILKRIREVRISYLCPRCCKGGEELSECRMHHHHLCLFWPLVTVAKISFVDHICPASDFISIRPRQDSFKHLSCPELRCRGCDMEVASKVRMIYQEGQQTSPEYILFPIQTCILQMWKSMYAQESRKMFYSTASVWRDRAVKPIGMPMLTLSSNLGKMSFFDGQKAPSPDPNAHKCLPSPRLWTVHLPLKTAYFITVGLVV